VASIYVHFPWCLSKCPYCDFVSFAVEPKEIDHAGYAKAVLREAEVRSRDIAKRGKPIAITSIYVGGGTPSLWEPHELGRVLKGFFALFHVSHDAEITVECNPTSLDRQRAIALRDWGVNRLSIGVQSLCAASLRFLGRRHDPDGARRAIDAALQAGIERLSADLIFGLPNQSADDARAEALALATTGVQHLSCYELSIEPDTLFGERRKRGLLPMADESTVADAFVAIDAALEARGFRHYEISNYATAGQESQHNLTYWRGDEYIGLGVAAFGFLRHGAGGTRYQNVDDPKKYIVATQAAPQPPRMKSRQIESGLLMSSESLDKQALFRERIMLGLRIAEGVDLARAGRDLGIDPWTSHRLKAIDKLTRCGRLTRAGDILRIPHAAWLYTNDTVSSLF